MVGQVVDGTGATVQLRPPGGGRGWEAAPEGLRLATPGERRRSGIHPVKRQRVRLSWVGPSLVTEEIAAPDLWGTT
ncbi:hypothetical protein AC230_04145 [Streptomyces caatingaensis]|uniref:Uncharacterized protein n=2 Tax=Streptomyces caatingaensis TaxID=1678637 RepID=A0A0K9XK92_9ACTN|nr:hypothetical protein AC230_04145 [Streptomyces caatingaensis]